MKEEVPGDEVGAEPGRRYLTLLFADLSHSTELAEIMETEHYAAMLAAVRDVYQDIVPRHGGMVVRVQGDGLLALFGYPLTREDDGRNAVAAALEVHQRVRQLKITLPAGFTLCLHTGIHSGLVLLHSGNVELGRFELLGPVPNIAARLSDAAEEHEILVSEETLGPASRFFVTGPPQLLKVKGRADKLLVYRVDARASIAESLAAMTRHGATAFFGRQSELAFLEQAMGDATAGHLRVVAVAGAPGMGKTRLIEHFISRVTHWGCAVLRGYCESDLGAEPLQPFHHMVQALASEAPPQTPDAFAELFARMAAEDVPLVLFVDDWQWADDASHQVLTALRKRAHCRLLVVLSIRMGGTSGVPAAADQVLALPPLGDEQAAQLVALRLPGADPFVAAEICAQANGNPLFLEELCHSAARGESARRQGRVPGGTGWLNRLVESRVQHLAPAQIELVRVASVIGNVVPAWLLERMTGQRTDGRLQLGLAEQDFLFPGERAGTLRFKHGLTRDIIYESVGLHVRQELHLRIAEALKQHSATEAHDEALALHFDAGGDAVQAAHYAEIAGDKALSASALDRARTLYRVALAALERLPQTAEVALRWVAIVQRLGRVCVFDPVRSELALYVRAVELAEQHGDGATVARARHWLGYISYGLGDARAAIVHGGRALDEARAAGDEKLAAQVVAALGEAHCATAQYERALVLLDDAIAVKRRHRSARHLNVGLAFSLVCRAYVLGDRGQFEQAHATFDEALACIEGVTHEIGASAHGWRSAVLLWQGRWAEAREAADESGRICEATRSLTQLSIARAMSAYADWMLTGRAECLQTILEVTAWLKPRGSGLFRSLNHGWLAAGLMEGGRGGEARHHAAQAFQRCRQGDLLGAAMSYRALARDAVERRPERVQHYLDQAFKAAAVRGSAHEVAVTQLCAADIAWRLNQAERARELVEEAVAGFTQMQMAWHLEDALRLRRLMDPAVQACSA